MSRRNVVVVGCGHGGVQTAASLRENGFDGTITLIGDELEIPYHRPPLSKSFILDESADLDPLRSATFYINHGVELLRGHRVTAVDLDVRCVVLDTCRQIAFDHLVLAPGSRNRILPVEGADLDGVFTLRSATDACAIRDRLTAAEDIVIIGGGFVGMEFAAAAASLGKTITVIEAAPRTMGRAVSRHVSEFLGQTLRAQGVNVLTAASVDRLSGRAGSVDAVICAGQRLAADLVLVGIGAVPNTELADDAGIAVGQPDCDGILVDQHLLTSHPAVSAVGDCAREQVGGAWLRLESVQNATDQARRVASRLTGASTTYARVPWFWSDQGRVKLQIAGVGVGVNRTVIRGDVGSGKFSVFGYRDERLLVVESINSPADHVAARKLLEVKATLTPDQAANPDFGLKDACVTVSA